MIQNARILGTLIVAAGAGVGVFVGIILAALDAFGIVHFRYLDYSYGFGASLTAATGAISGHDYLKAWSNKIGPKDEKPPQDGDQQGGVANR